jgi:type IV pilus assembly protein PilW
MAIIMRLKKNQRGFSLPELLIALALASLVGMAAYTVFTSSSRSTTGQEDVTEAQQNVRIALERMARDIRAAGFGLPDPPFSLSIGGVSHISPVAITNSASAPDSITLLGIGHFAGTLQTGGNTDCNEAGKGKICLSSVGEFKSGSSFVADRQYVSFDGVRYFVLASTQTASDLDACKLVLVSPDTLDRTYPDGTQVFIIQAVRYTRNTALEGCSSENPCLTREALTWNNQVVAQNIEDLQFAYSRNGSASFSSGTTSDVDITAVRVNLVGRTRRQVLGGSGASSRPALADRPAASADNYRRRVLTSVVKVRNPRVGS